MDSPNTATAQRFVAIDAHKAYVMIGAVDAQQNVVLEPRRVDLAQFPTWIAKNLSPSDAVALEVTTNAWHLYDQVCACGCAVVIANPLAVKLIAETAVKSDRRDTLTLARLLACGFLPTIWVPPPHVRLLRDRVARRAPGSPAHPGPEPSPRHPDSPCDRRPGGGPVLSPATGVVGGPVPRPGRAAGGAPGSGVAGHPGAVDR